MPEPRMVFTPDEAAEFLRYSTNTLGQWRYEGRGPAYTKIRGRVRYRRPDLEEWLSGDDETRERLEETAPIHLARRTKPKRLRGRLGAAQRSRRIAREPHCRFCAENGITRMADHVDHIVPLEDGGPDTDDNVRGLCEPCHKGHTRRRKIAKTAEIRAARLRDQKGRG